MKKIFLFIFSALISMGLQAQTLDSANFECIYKLDYIMDLLKPDVSKADEMRLLIGDNYTEYRSYTNYTIDSLQKANPDEYSPRVIGANPNVPVSGIESISVMPARTVLRKSDNKDIFYTNRKTNEIIVRGEIMTREIYSFDEKAILPDWEITGETETVMGYMCQKAVARFGGRNWTVWFAPEISIAEGPWKFRGLPGLILKAEDEDKQYVFECTAFQRLNTKKPITINTDIEHRKISKTDYYKQVKNFYEDPIVAINKRVEGTAANITIKGNPNASLTKKYNPIELE